MIIRSSDFKIGQKDCWPMCSAGTLESLRFFNRSPISGDFSYETHFDD